MAKKAIKLKQQNKSSLKADRKPVKVVLPRRGPTTIPVGEALKLAAGFAEKGQWPEVIGLVKQITSQLPGYMPAWELWFRACHKIGDFTQLDTVAGQCLSHKPRALPALIARCVALRMLQRHPEALDSISKARKAEPTNVSVLNHLGIVLKELGDNEPALDAFNRCIALKPDHTQAYWNRSDLLKEPTPEQLNDMHSMLMKTSLTPDQRARMHYALARAYEFLGDTESQYEQIEKGATSKRQSVNYEHSVEMAQMQRIPECFTEKVLSQNTKPHSKASVPIFICGLPRSGTTLIEQILSSHPQVFPGGEINALPLAVAQGLRVAGIEKPFPEWAADLAVADWERIGELYYEHTRNLQTQPFFTDKNLQNYKGIGLIHLALPEAKIIYCRRDPMDNLWGCYRQLFGDGQHYTYDQIELAETWKAADAALRYWKKELKDRLFILDYEELVQSQEQVTRQLLAYIGLGWDDACLHFYNNPRAVATISSVQVRQPMTNARIGKWKAFRQHLSPMKSVIDTWEKQG